MSAYASTDIVNNQGGAPGLFPARPVGSARDLGKHGTTVFTSLRAVQAMPLGRRTPHRVANELIGRINRGVYKHGSWLPTEQELLGEFPISRAALREALTILQVLGLIEPRRSVGTKILGGKRPVEDRFDPSLDLLAMLEACCFFEVESAVAAAGQPDGRCAPKAPQGPPDLEHFRHFHLGLAQATGNLAIAISIKNLWDLILDRPNLRATFEAAISYSQTDYADLQAAVSIAVAAQDRGAARAAAKALFHAYLDSVFDLEEWERLCVVRHENARLRSVWKQRLSTDPESHAPPRPPQPDASARD